MQAEKEPVLAFKAICVHKRADKCSWRGLL